MAKIEVTAKAFDPATGSPQTESRIEIIDSTKNRLFKNCKTLTDVAETYMRFWNRLPTTQSEMILVQSIRWV